MDNLDKLESKEKELYKVNYTPIQEDVSLGNDSPQSNSGLNREWVDEIQIDEPKKKGPLFKFLLLSIAILLLASAYLGFTYYAKLNSISGDKISIVLSEDTFIESGTSTNFQFSLSNNNKENLRDVTIYLDYVKLDGKDTESEKVYEKVFEGDLLINETKTFDKDIMIYGRDGDNREVKVVLDYMIDGSNAKYKKEYVKSYVIKSDQLSIRNSGANDLSLGEDNNLSYVISNNSNNTISDVAYKVTLPIGLNFVNYNKSDQTFYVGNIKPRESKAVSFTVVAAGTSGEEKLIKIEAGNKINENRINVLTNLDDKFNIAKEFITINVEDSQSQDIALDNNYRHNIKFKNVSTTSVNTNRIQIKFESPLIDYDTLSSDKGNFDKNSRTLTINAKDLSNPEMPASFETTISIFYRTVKQLTSNNTNHNIIINYFGDTTGDGAKQVTASKILRYNLGGELSLKGSTYFTSGDIVNNGLLPPVVNKPTSYTLYFELGSKSKSFERANLSINLPKNVKYNNKFFPDNSDVIYDSKNNSLQWNAGTLSIGETKYLQVQVILTPSNTDIDTIPVLATDIRAVAYEVNKNSSVNKNIDPLTTVLGEPTEGDLSKVLAK